MQVTATARGYCGQKLREVDETFEMDLPDDYEFGPTDWFVPVNAPVVKTEKSAKGAKAPKTLSEHAEQNPEPLA